jgi:hypothetical protein
LKRGLESLTSGTGVRFSSAVTRRLLRPFHRRMHRLRFPGREATTQSYTLYQHPGTPRHPRSFSKTFHRLPRLSTRHPPTPYRVLHRGDRTYSIEVRGDLTTVSIDRLKPASPPAISYGVTTRSSRRVRFTDYLGCSGYQPGGGGGGECHCLYHTHSVSPPKPTELRVQCVPRQADKRGACG